MVHYFAYGSNLHPVRLMERVPSARLVGVTSVTKHRLTFHKRSLDGSGKCTLLKTGSELDIVHGVIYALKPGDKAVLDRYEMKGHGYADNDILLSYQGIQYRCFIYVAQQQYVSGFLKPYHWYKKLVISGALYLKFPEPYIHFIDSVESVEDPDIKRCGKNDLLLHKIHCFR